MFAPPLGVDPRTPERNAGFTLIELLVVIAIIAIIAAIAIPGLLRSRVAANEGSAIASLRTISSAQAAFASSCGGGGYAQTLVDLGRAPMGSAPFLPTDLSTGEKAGYGFVLEGAGKPVADPAATCNGSAEGTMSGFLATANPITDGGSGVRAFGLDDRAAMRWTAAAAGITDSASYASAMNLE